MKVSSQTGYSHKKKIIIQKSLLWNQNIGSRRMDWSWIKTSGVSHPTNKIRNKLHLNIESFKNFLNFKMEAIMLELVLKMVVSLKTNQFLLQFYPAELHIGWPFQMVLGSPEETCSLTKCFSRLSRDKFFWIEFFALWDKICCSVLIICITTNFEFELSIKWICLNLL